MQHSPGGEWDKEGCFVYKIVIPCSVRSLPNIKDDYRTANNADFQIGDLVSVDLVAASRYKDSRNTPFLRLVDKSGWLFEEKNGQVMMERMPIEKGIWIFYADNYPVGIALRKHPIDRKEQCVEPYVTFLPMQKVFCDRKVISDTGVNFYRVQGTGGWLFDRRGEVAMLLPESLVRTGLFAFQNIANCAIAVRNKANVAETSKSGDASNAIQSNEIMAVDVVCTSPQNKSGDGPFLRLADGRGWLFENKQHQRLMEEIPVMTGLWTFRVMNPDGITARFHPIDKTNFITPTVYNRDDECICDKMITSSSGVNFYKVKDKITWVFDKRNGQPMMEELRSLDHSINEGRISSQGSWTPDFVRGVVLAVGGLVEVSFNDLSRVISFQNDDGVRFNIYYTTRTIGTAMNHSRQQHTQLFRRDCSDSELTELLRNPRLHTSRGYQYKRSRVDNSFSSSNDEVDGEVDLREALLGYDEEARQLQSRRAEVLKSILVHSEKRASFAKRFDKMRDAQERILEAKAKKKQCEIEERHNMRQREIEEQNRQLR